VPGIGLKGQAGDELKDKVALLALEADPPRWTATRGAQVIDGLQGLGWSARREAACDKAHPSRRTRVGIASSARRPEPLARR
jgi:hypothetical protein